MEMALGTVYSLPLSGNHPLGEKNGDNWPFLQSICGLSWAFKEVVSGWVSDQPLILNECVCAGGHIFWLHVACTIRRE